MSSPSHEFAYIDWLRQQTPAESRVILGPGDDCAIVRGTGTSPLLITTDMLLEGSCFLLEEAGPRRVGRKAMSVNLSDIAAMAGIPLYAVVSVGLPRQGGRELAEELYRGLREVADHFQVSIVGGDTNSWTGGLVISVTLFGQATERGAVPRSGAKPGDWILVTGPLGGSILGKHLDFTPRVREARELHQFCDLHAMIDISDGLSQDLHHLCEESHCGAILHAEAIPISQAAHEQANQDGKRPLEHALSDGEDFELLFTVSPEDGSRLLRDQPVSGIQLVKIGEMTSSSFEIEENGINRKLEPKGYEHEI